MSLIPVAFWILTGLAWGVLIAWGMGVALSPWLVIGLCLLPSVVGVCWLLLYALGKLLSMRHPIDIEHEDGWR